MPTQPPSALLSRRLSADYANISASNIITGSRRGGGSQLSGTRTRSASPTGCGDEARGRGASVDCADVIGDTARAARAHDDYAGQQADDAASLPDPEIVQGDALRTLPSSPARHQ